MPELNKWIRVSEEVHERLKELGRKGESFDEILRRMLTRNVEA